MKPLIILSILAKALDVHSTCSALSKGGYDELNPYLSNNCKTQIVVHSGLIVGQSVLLFKLNETHPKLAKAIIISLSGIEFSLAYHNYKEVKK